MDNSLVTVATDYNATTAELIRNLLLDHGIDCQLDGVQQGGFAGAQRIGILVRTEDADRAKQLIKENESD